MTATKTRSLIAVVCLAIVPALHPALPGAEGKPGDLDRIRAEVKRSGTTAENARERYDVLIAWVRIRVREGKKVDSVLPREKGRRIAAMLRGGRVGAAGPLIDEAYKALDKLMSADADAPGKSGRVPAQGRPYGKGAKALSVDAGQVVGKIRSLLGTNRGPISFPRRGRESAIGHVESYRKMGIDFIRTHDFYGPTDWHVIFPKFSADPADAKSYDFESSDVRIKAICDNGFACYFRLGTSWKGRQTRPINDPPGTVRDASGRVTHRADRDDFRKWAKICTQTVRHYTRGWKDGFKYPIKYWEIWNEPDLAAQFWTGTPEQFYQMYEEAARAIKALDASLMVGGPACTGAMRDAYVEGFIRYCRDRKAPLDFFSWHSYGGRGEFNPYLYCSTSVMLRKLLDKYGFKKTEVINSEWNSGIKHMLFNDTPAGAAFYASALANMLDGGLARAFQYCGDRHPGLGMHDMQTAKPKISAQAFVAWKMLLGTPDRLEASGSDKQGYNIVAGRDADKKLIRILISDFRSGYDKAALSITNLPWTDQTPFTVTRRLIDATHLFEVVATGSGKGRTLTLEIPFAAGRVCLIEIARGSIDPNARRRTVEANGQRGSKAALVGG